MKRNLLKFLLIGVFFLLFSITKAFSQVTVTGLAGNASQYLAQGATNQVVFGFSVKVPGGKTFNPGVVHIATTNGLNGFVSGNLVQTASATPGLAVTAPLGTYAAAINGTIDINSFPSVTAIITTTYYYYLVLSITTTANPQPSSVVFSIPTPSTAFEQNPFTGGTNITNLASPTTYYFAKPAISYATPQTYTYNTAISTLSASSTGGGVVTYTATTTLPTGLSINAATGDITGTPTAVSAAANYTITATNPAGSSTAIINIAVLPKAPTVGSVSQCGAGETLTASGGLPAGGTYNWYTVATGGTAVQSSTATTLTNIQNTATYYVSYTSGGVASTRTAATATIYPTVSSPMAGISFSYPFDAGSLTDISQHGNTATSKYTNASSTGPTTTTDRFGVANTAYNFDGLGQYLGTTSPYADPETFTISLWFSTTTTQGGKLIGFDNLQSPANGSAPSAGQFDRHIYMTNSGQLYFGVYNSGTHVISSTLAYNDGNWHHVVVTFGPTHGEVMYVDGVSVANNASFTAAEPYTGYWRIGGDNLSGWSSAPTSNFFGGKIDDVSVTSTEETAAQVAASNNLNLIGYPATAQCLSSSISFSAQTITGATYTWQDSGGNTQTGQNVTFPTGTAGAYTLTVTGGPGGCSSTATVTPTFLAAPSATFTSPATVIMGNSITATYTGTEPATDTYVWNFGGGTPALYNGQTPPAVSFATPGTYNIKLTVTNSSGCYTTTTNVINVYPAAPTATSVTQCGAGASLTATGTPAGGVYNWYTAATGGTAIQSGSSAAAATLSNIQSTATYYVSYSVSSVESARTPVTATINPIISAPYSGAYFSYPFNGNTNDVSSYGNAGTNNGATLTTDRYNTSNAAYSFNGSSSYITDPFLDNNPSTYTVSIWFNTTSTTGGALIGLESSNAADRVLYMSNSGQVYWGLNVSGTIQTINTTMSYNDGDWHHVIVTVSSTGSTLYIDGVSQASSASMTTGNGLNGYWQMGYITLSSWTNAPTNNYFTGKLDDIAVYHRVLSATEISTSNDLNQIYVGTATACSALTFNAPTITGATYTWKDPNNNTQTGQSVSFPGAVAGNYTLTVTGGPGGCSSTVTLTPVIYNSTTAAFNLPASITVNTNTTISLYSGVGSSTYTWNFGGGTSSSGTTGQGPFSVQWSTTGVKTVTLTVTTSGGCSITTTQNITVTSTAYGNYTYNRTITLNNKAVGITTNLSSFPVLVSIQSNDLIVSGTCADIIQNPTSNYDFAFFDPSAQSELNYQVESYNTTTGTLLVWVRVPTLYAATNNTLLFYYGAKVPAVTHNAAFFANTWTADYQAIYHFNESAYTGISADGTSNGRTASLAGFSASNYVAAGKIGSCYTFGGVEDMEAPAVAPSSVVTMSAWINTSNNNVDEKVITDQNSVGTGSNGYKLGVYYGSAETEDDGYINRSSNTPAEPTPLSTGTWYYVQGVYDGTTMSTYVNGVQYKKYTVTSTSTFTNTLYIGIGEGKIYPFNGMIDEPRVSNSAKSSDWIKMEYVNQNNPTAFIVSTSAASVTAANAVGIPGELSYTWNGSTSTDPSVAANWTNSVTGVAGSLPLFDGSATLTIPTGLSKYPALTAPISVYGLNIASGASLNLNGNIMSVGCHIYNGSGGQILYGTSSTSGGITFNGSLSTQYYYGTTTGIANVANLTVNNGGTVKITGGAFGVTNMLTLTSGNLVIDNAGSGSLTLLSSATNSASVAAIPTGSTITGRVNVQRYLTSGAGTRGYRLLSSPVNISTSTSGTGNLSLTYLNTNNTFNGTTYYGAYTQGPGTGFTYNGSVHPIIYLYDESQATNNSTFTGGKNIGVYTITGSSGSPAYGVITQGVSVASSAVTVPVANSYLLYFVGSDQSTSVASSRVPDATTLTATGYLNQGDVPFTFWKTASTSLPYDVTTGTTNYGLFQVGNPYASTINLNTFYTDNYNSSSNKVGSAFYELIPAGNYVSYDASNGHVSDLRASQYIVSGQGFLAQTTANGQTFTFKEDQKVTYHSSSTLLESFPSGPTLADAHIVNNMPAKGNKVKTNAIIAPVVTTSSGDSTGLHLQLALDTANFAQTGIYFSLTASDKYVNSEDAVEIDGGTPTVYLSSYSSDSVKLSINTLSDYAQGKRIRLYAYGTTSGVYTMSLADIAQMDTADYNVYLVDNLQKDSLDLIHYKTYTFNINTADTTTFGSNRFVLAIDHKSVAKYILSTFSGQKVSTGVQLNWTAVNAGNYTGYTLQKLNANGGYDSLYTVQSDTSITKYSYIDTHPIIGNNTYRLAQNGIAGAITYSANVTVGYNSSTPNGALTLYPNPASTIINVNMSSTTINSPTYVVNIYNALGAVVKNEKVSSATWTDDVSSYNLGVYVMQVKDTNGNIIGQAKFVKVN